MSNNRVGDYGIMMAKLSLLANRSLLKLTLCNTRITCEGARLNTVECFDNLYILGAIALAEFVAESRMLEQLDLRDNDIRIAGLMALALAHKMNHKLYRLSMPRTIKIEPVCCMCVCIYARVSCIHECEYVVELFILNDHLERQGDGEKFDRQHRRIHGPQYERIPRKAEAAAR